MPHREPRFSAPSTSRDRVERIGSALAFALLICIWIAGYVTFVPADPMPHQTHVAAARL